MKIYNHISINLIREACEKDDLELLKIIVPRFHNKISYYDKLNILHRVCMSGNIDILNFFISINWLDPHVLINNACLYGQLDIIKHLHSIGCDLTVNDNYAIKSASMYGKLEIVKWLYSIGCDPFANNSISWAYHHSCEIETVKFLALIGGDTNVIINKEIREKVLEYLNEYKHVFNKCMAEIHGHPSLERTKTENINSFKLSDLNIN